MGYKRAMNMKNAVAALIFALLPFIGGNIYAAVGCENIESNNETTTYCVSPYSNPSGSALNTSPAFSPAWTKVSSDEYRVGGGQYIQFQVEKGTIYKWSTEGSEDLFQGNYAAACTTDSQCGYRLACQGGYCLLPFHTELTLFGNQCGPGGANVLAFSREGSFYNQAELEWKSEISGTVTLLVTNYEYRLVENADHTFDSTYVSCQPTSGVKTTTVKWQRSVAEHCTECDDASKYAYNATVEVVQEVDDADNPVLDEHGDPVTHENYNYNPKQLPTDGSAYAPFWDIIQSGAPQSASAFSHYDDWIKPGSYIIFHVDEGQIYRWSTCISQNDEYDTQLTLFKGRGKTGDCGDFLAYGDDAETSYKHYGDSTNYCPAGTKQTVLEWHANFTGDVTLLFNEYNCYQCSKHEIGSHWAHCYETRENEEHTTMIYPMPLEWQRYDCICSSSNGSTPVASIADTCGMDIDDYGDLVEKPCASKWEQRGEDEDFSATIDNVGYGKYVEFSLRRGSKYLFSTQDTSALITIKKLSDGCGGKTLAQGTGKLAYFADSEVPSNADDDDPNHYADEVIVLVTKAECGVADSDDDSTRLSYSFYSDPASSDMAARFSRFNVNGYGKFIDNSPNGLTFIDSGRWAKTWQEAMEVCNDPALGGSASGIVACPMAECPEGTTVPSALAGDPDTNVWCAKGRQGTRCASTQCGNNYSEYTFSGDNKGKCYYNGSCDPVRKAKLEDHICKKYGKTGKCLLYYTIADNYYICDLSANPRCVTKTGLCGTGAPISSLKVGISTDCPIGYDEVPGLSGCYKENPDDTPDSREIICNQSGHSGVYTDCDQNFENVTPTTPKTCEESYPNTTYYGSGVDGCTGTGKYVNENNVAGSIIIDYSKCYPTIATAKNDEASARTPCACSSKIYIVTSSGNSSSSISSNNVARYCPKPKCGEDGYIYHKAAGDSSSSYGKCYPSCPYTLVDGTNGNAHCYRCYNSDGYSVTKDEDDDLSLNGYVCAKLCPSGQTAHNGTCYYVGSTGGVSCASGWLQDPSSDNTCRKQATDYSGYVGCPQGGQVRCDDLHTNCDTSKPNSEETWCYENYCGEDFKTDENLRVCPDGVTVTLDGYEYNLGDYQPPVDVNVDGITKRICEVELPTGKCGKPLGSWVLPNINQLYSIVDFDLHDPATAIPFVGNTYVRYELNKSCAPTTNDKFGDKQCYDSSIPGVTQGDGHWICMDGRCVRNNWYWSSTTVVNGSDDDGEFVWSVNMEDGRSYRAPKGCVDDETNPGDDCAGVTFNSRPHKVLCVKGSYYAGLFDAGLPAKEQTFSGWVCNKSAESKKLRIYFDIVDSSGINKEGKNVIPLLTNNDAVMATLPGTSRKVLVYGLTDKLAGNEWGGVTTGKPLAIYNNCAAVGQDPATVTAHAFEIKWGSVSGTLAETIKSIGDITECTEAQIANNTTSDCVVPPFFVTAYAADPELEESGTAIAFEVSPVHQPFVLKNVCGDGYKTFDGNFLETCEIDDFDKQCAYGTGTCPFCPQETTETQTACKMEYHDNPQCGDGTIQSAYCENGKISAGHIGAGEDCEYYAFDNEESSENCECGDGHPDTMYLYENGVLKCDGAHKVTTTSCPVYNQDCEICSGCGRISGNKSYCGDGHLQRSNCEGYGDNCEEMEGADEECDNSNPNACSPECKLPRCGDGHIQNDEKCDDGAENGTYGKCNETCTDTVRCGDGIIEREDCTGYGNNCVVSAGADEVCDLGDDRNGAAIKYSDFIDFRDENGVLINQDCAVTLNGVSYPINAAQGDLYKNCVVRYAAWLKEHPGCTECRVASASYCGDGDKNTSSGEDCDEKLPVNADGTFNEALTEEDSYNGKSYKNCALDCHEYACGNNVLEVYSEGTSYTSIGFVDDNGKVNLYVAGAEEICDDGTNNGKYGHCNRFCNGDARCGNKKTEEINEAEGLSEECDNGSDNLSIELGYDKTKGVACVVEDGTVCAGEYENWGSFRCCVEGRYCGDGTVDNGEGLGEGSASEKQYWRTKAAEEGTWVVNGVTVGQEQHDLAVKFTKNTDSSEIATAELQVKLPGNTLEINKKHRYYLEYDFEVKYAEATANNVVIQSAVNMYGAEDNELRPDPDLIEGRTFFKETSLPDNGYSKWIHVRSDQVKGASSEGSATLFIEGTKYVKIVFHFKGNAQTHFLVRGLKFYAVETVKSGNTYGLPQSGVDNSAEMCDPGTAHFETTSNRYMTDCNSSCQWINFCGDGIVQISGSDCGTLPPCDDTTTENCCKTGITDAAEVCDKGVQNAPGVYNGCEPGCLELGPHCGDYIVDIVGSCDPTDRRCLAPIGIAKSEACDGNNCSEGPETCSPNNDARLTNGGEGFSNSDNYGVCRTDCSWARCGDGILDDGEECDCGVEGSATRTTASTSWQLDDDSGVPVCHDGDTQYYNTNKKVNRSVVCRSNCKISRCGDGILDKDEKCDDGNHDDNDSCIGCKLARCGDSYYSYSRSYLCEELREIPNELAVKAWRDKGVIDCVDDSGHANSCSEFIDMTPRISDEEPLQYNDGPDSKLVRMFKAGYLHCCYDRKLEGLDADYNCQFNDGTAENPHYQTPYELSFDKENGRFEGCDRNAPKSKEACETQVGLSSSDPRTPAACAAMYETTSSDYKACVTKITKYNKCVADIEMNTYCNGTCTDVIGRCGDGKVDIAAGEKCDKFYGEASFDNAGKYQKLDGSWVYSVDSSSPLAQLGKYCTGDWVGETAAMTPNAPMCGGSYTSNCWSDGCTVKWHSSNGNDSNYSKAGDTRIDKYAGEECDMGITDPEDHTNKLCGGDSDYYRCSRQCKLNGATCGDGIVQATSGGTITAEVCDTVTDIEAFNICYSKCRFAQGNDDIDYGITNGEEGCKKACVYAGYCDNCSTSFGYCGDGEIHAPANSQNIEEIDRLLYNAVKDGGPEDCDNKDPRTLSLEAAGLESTSFCNSCQRVGSCGDGERNPRFEACDCGNASSSCTTATGRTCKAGCKMDSIGAITKANSTAISGWACDPDHPLKGATQNDFIKITFEYDNNGTMTSVGSPKYVKPNEDVTSNDIVLECGGGKTHGWKTTDFAGLSVPNVSVYTVKAYAWDFDLQDYVLIDEMIFSKKKTCGDGAVTKCDAFEVTLSDNSDITWNKNYICCNETGSSCTGCSGDSCNEKVVKGNCVDFGLEDNKACVDEECDDGNKLDGDDCNSTCTAWTSCGDETLQTAATGSRPDQTAAEQCDNPAIPADPSTASIANNTQPEPNCSVLASYFTNPDPTISLQDALSGTATCYNHGENVAQEKKCKWNKGSCKLISKCNGLDSIVDTWDTTNVYKKLANTYIKYKQKDGISDTLGRYHRTWNETTNDWSAENPELNFGGNTATDELETTECYFECVDALGWNSTTERCVGRTDNTPCNACDDENGVWNGGDSNGKPCKATDSEYQAQPLSRESSIDSNGEIVWNKDINATFSETNTNGCFYKCKDGTQWSGESPNGKCNVEEKPFRCGSNGSKPANSVWVKVVKEWYMSGNEVKWRRIPTVYNGEGDMVVTQKLQDDHTTYIPAADDLKPLWVEYTHKDEDNEWKYNWKKIPLEYLSSANGYPTTPDPKLAVDTPTKCYFQCIEGYGYNPTTERCEENFGQGYCGDGVIDSEDCTSDYLADPNDVTHCKFTIGGTEKCDDAGNNGQYKKAGGRPSYCNTDCTAKIKDGNEYFCGDGVTQYTWNGQCYDTTCKPVIESNYPDATITDFAVSEQCDSSDTSRKHLCDIWLKLNRKNTASTYYESGTITCNGCKIEPDGTPCGYCGDGVRQSNETCENTSAGIEYAGATEPFNKKSKTWTYNTSTGAQTPLTIPITGIYKITVAGGNGGHGGGGEGNTSNGGAGATGGKISAQYFIQKGKSLTLYVGAKGNDGVVGVDGDSGDGGSGGALGGVAGKAGTTLSTSDPYEEGYCSVFASRWSGGGGGGGGGSSYVMISTQKLLHVRGGGGGGGGEGKGSGGDGDSGDAGSGAIGGAKGSGNRACGGDGGDGGNGGRYDATNSVDNYHYDTTTLNNGYKFISGSYSGDNSKATSDAANGSITIELVSYAPCKSDCTGFDETNLVNAGTSKTACQGLPANAEWWLNPAEVTQTQSGSSWTPSEQGSYSATNPGSGANVCKFKCQSGYYWVNNACVSTRVVYCPTLTTPTDTNWEWNTVSQIQQAYSGTDWTPADTVSYNETPTTSECRFKCKDGFVYEQNDYTYTAGGTSHTVEGNHCRNEKTIDCNNATLPLHATWWKETVDLSWTPTAEWQPTTTGEWKETDPNTNGCFFHCNHNYTWDSSSSTCVAKVETVDCEHFPTQGHATWWRTSSTTAPQITRTWDEDRTGCDKTDADEDCWTITKVGALSTTERLDGCYFHCDQYFEDYNSTTNQCVSETRTFSCTNPPDGLAAFTLPDNAEWNTVSSYTQSGTESGWSPVNSTATHNNSAGGTTQACWFKCKENFTWTGSECEPDKKYDQACTDLPSGSVWTSTGTTTQTITQTWTHISGSTWDWRPVLTGEYNTETDSRYCRYKCDGTHTRWNNACVNKRTMSCNNLTLDNTVWSSNNSTSKSIEQEWKKIGDTWQWTPSLDGTHSTDTDANKCYYKCESEGTQGSASAHFYWNNGACVANTRNANCADVPDNAVRWGSSAAIQQTWTNISGSTWDWRPITTSTYSSTNDGGCTFHCYSSGREYSWTGSACKYCNDGEVSDGETCDTNISYGTCYVYVSKKTNDCGDCDDETTYNYKKYTQTCGATCGAWTKTGSGTAVSNCGELTPACK